MLFNSYTFIFAFLPAVLALYYLLCRTGRASPPLAFLVLASLFYYGWWKPEYLLLIIASMLVNFRIGTWLGRWRAGDRRRRLLAVAGVVFNLGLLAYFKYTGFLIENLNLLGPGQIRHVEIVLPLAISFFTFQQITYLVDSYRFRTSEYRFVHYCLFVSFFPQLIAGPIVHHREMMPQFADPGSRQFSWTNLAAGTALFVFGLAKKVIIADALSPYAGAVFAAADGGLAVDSNTAWLGATAYGLQIYFDFSGYTDMATGLALMFGIVLPWNFYSPYQAVNIIDFWRRWHITLSRFLRDYLYIPLGGNRKGPARRYTNLLLTMLIGGLWHGASWNFVIWGGLHGLLLCLNHGWQSLVSGRHFRLILPVWCSRLLTLAMVMLAWVYFRAQTFTGANAMAVSMLTGGEGERILPDLTVAVIILAGGLIALAAPNARAYVLGDSSMVDQGPRFQAGAGTAVLLAVLFFACIMSLSSPSEFLYYQF